MSAFEDAELVMAPSQTRLMQFLPQLGASNQQSVLGLAWDLAPAPFASASSIQVEAKTMQSGHVRHAEVSDCDTYGRTRTAGNEQSCQSDHV